MGYPITRFAEDLGYDPVVNKLRAPYHRPLASLYQPLAASHQPLALSHQLFARSPKPLGKEFMGLSSKPAVHEGHYKVAPYIPSNEMSLSPMNINEKKSNEVENPKLMTWNPLDWIEKKSDVVSWNPIDGNKKKSNATSRNPLNRIEKKYNEDENPKLMTWNPMD